jgi:hypothetical protein
MILKTIALEPAVLAGDAFTTRKHEQVFLRAATV